MQLRKATRVNTKIKMALQGPSGSGKTYSALLIAYGIIGDWNKIAVIDTEKLSAHLGEFNVLSITAPYSPEKFSEAISFCERSEIQLIIIDSMSHAWEGSGGILDIHSGMSGNSFTNWGKLTPRHNAFIDAILKSPAHIIATLRTKQDYVLTEKNGKVVPEKVGLKAIQRDGTDYEFTLVFDLDIKHHATASKDRTGLFVNKPPFLLDSKVGKQVLEWCNEGTNQLLSTDTSFIQQRINDCKSIEELLKLYTDHPEFQEQLMSDFTKKKQELKPEAVLLPSINQVKPLKNGTRTK